MDGLPTSKYRGEQHPRYGGKLHWPGANGLPFMGTAAPSLKQHEVEGLAPQSLAREYTFDMNVQEDAEYYNWVRDRIVNGLFVRDYIERKWDPVAKIHIIFMEWRQLYVQAPPQHRHVGSNGHGSPKQFTLRPPGE
jgi:hypothetical protein